MASRIEPGPAPKPAAPPAKPAAPKPATPAAARPAGQPPQAAKPAEQPREDDAHDDRPRGSMGFLKTAPAWAVSMLVHIIALLGMALMVTPPPEKETIRVITSSNAEPDEEFEEIAEETPVDAPEQTNVADVVVPTDVAVVTDVNVVTNSDDVEAAPLAVELTDFGSSSAVATDMMASIGAVGGKGNSGLGARSNAAAVAAQRGGGIDTEQAVDRALKWFIEHQMPDGGWSFDLSVCPKCAGKCSHGTPKRKDDRCAATAMALLPFYGRGYTHREGPYKQQLEAGIAYLAGLSMKGKGKVYVQKDGGSLYSQGLAGIALTECYAMTEDQRLQMPAQLALNFIMEAQNPANGGWQYTPRQGGDTSVVGWQLMALKSGHMAYLQVNPETVKKAVAFLDSVESESGARYGYSDNSTPTDTRSAIGLLCRMYLGWKKDHPALQAGVARIAKPGPTKDLYHNYYATQVLHHMEGDMWLAWNEKMKKMLLSTQAVKGHEAGSWYEGFEGGHSPEYGGRLCSTSFATMILEVYYRHLPIYRNESVEAEFKE